MHAMDAEVSRKFEYLFEGSGIIADGIHSNRSNNLSFSTRPVGRRIHLVLNWKIMLSETTPLALYMDNDDAYMGHMGIWTKYEGNGRTMMYGRPSGVTWDHPDDPRVIDAALGGGEADKMLASLRVFTSEGAETDAKTVRHPSSAYPVCKWVFSAGTVLEFEVTVPLAYVKHTVWIDRERVGRQVEAMCLPHAVGEILFRELTGRLPDDVELLSVPEYEMIFDCESDWSAREDDDALSVDYEDEY
jgi:hypothetical protein